MMAARFEEDLQCPSCLEIFKDPVFLPCSHSICRTCVEKWWEDKDSRPCPVCRTECRSMELPSNLTLRNMCEKVSTKSDDMCKAFSQISTKSKDLCRSHKEKLKLFCLDHQELVCLVCRDSEIHANHKFRPIDEVAKGNKKKLQKVLLDVKERLKDYNEVMDKCNEFSEYIKVQREKVESKIKKDFEELRHFLQVEEEARLSAVREEERNKTQILKEGMKALNMYMVALSNMIRTAEEQLMSDDLSLMKNFQTLMTRMQKPSDKPEQIRKGYLLDEAKHVGNLKFTVWERMKEIVSYSPVILDPHAAGVRLSLSEDLTSVSAADEKQHRPQNAEVCGKNAVCGYPLTSPMNIWEVEVGDNTDWLVGVVWGQSFPGEFWIAFRDDEYTIYSKAYERWYPSVKLKRIRFHVDTNKGSLSVTESLTNTFLHQENLSNWTQSSDMKILPLFFTRDKNPLKILPVPHRVTIQNQ